MADSYIRQRFHDILAQRANILSGGDADGTGLLIGDGRRRKVGRPSRVNAMAVKRRAAAKKAMMPRRRRVGRGMDDDDEMMGEGRKKTNPWQKHLAAVRRKHKGLPASEIAKIASKSYHKK